MARLRRKAHESVAWAWLASLARALLASVFFGLPLQAAAAAGHLGDHLPQVRPAELFAGADRFGPQQGDPPIAPVYGGDRLLGYAYLNTDLTTATGYSGKPIHLVVGIDTDGVVRGIKLVEQVGS